jgi:pyrroline-5-carboxylate reductase
LNKGFGGRRETLNDMLVQAGVGKLLLVGCGNMGAALVRGWQRGGLDVSSMSVLEPRGAAATGPLNLAADQIHTSPDTLTPADVVLLSVKPQVAAELLPKLLPAVHPDTLVISIMAGFTLRAMADGLGGHHKLVRAMPNTPAAIGQGVTVAVKYNGLGEAAQHQTERLLSAIGLVRWTPQESQLDAVTALSGSGPAYVFYLIECLTSAGESLGLSKDLAQTLAIETVAGAGALARSADADPASLRQQVTSPNGTTQAGLDVLMSATGGLAPLVRHTLEAAAKRSRELGK